MSQFPDEALVFEVLNFNGWQDADEQKVREGAIVEFLGEGGWRPDGQWHQCVPGYFAARVISEEDIVTGTDVAPEMVGLLGFYAYQQGCDAVKPLTPAARLILEQVKATYERHWDDDDEGKAGDQGD